MTTAEDPVFCVEMLPAAHGDCILLTYGQGANLHTVLVDGGPAASYEQLAARIRKIRDKRLELVVISHVDSDHIGGIVKLLGDRELGVQIDEFWFNGWGQLIKPLRALHHRDPRLPIRGDERSVMEGHHVAHRARLTGLKWNQRFHGSAICVEKGRAAPELLLAGGMKITLLSPTVECLERLRTEWNRRLSTLKVDPTKHASLIRRLEEDRRYRTARGPAIQSMVENLSSIAVALDSAVANGSSIAFLAEYRDKRCLMLADAHMPVIESAVNSLMREYGEDRLRLDAIKVSHHGSKANMSEMFLKLVECNRYLISTDGSFFGHPDREAVAQIIRFGGKSSQLFFNYYSPHNRCWADSGWQTELQYQAFYPRGFVGRPETGDTAEEAAACEAGISIDLFGNDTAIGSGI